MSWARRTATVVTLFMLAVPLSTGAAAADDPPTQASFQGLPITSWAVPGADPLDGIGEWVYVVPPPAAGPDQLATIGYVYGPNFMPAGNPGGNGVVGLSSDATGGVAGISMRYPGAANTQTATVRYDWSPGRFYFAFAYHLGGRWWGGWVYDLAATSWTFVGAVQAPETWTLLDPTGFTVIRGAEGTPMLPFFDGAIPGPAASILGGCAVYPRVDAYFSQPIGFRGSTATVATVTSTRTGAGVCATTATVESGWFHHQLGSLAAA